MISKMEHVAIMVKDIAQSIQFYSEIFGFKVLLRGRKPDREMAFLFLPSQPNMEMELIQEFDTTNQYSENGIVNHLAFTVEDIETTIGYLKGKNITFSSDEIKPSIEEFGCTTTRISKDSRLAEGEAVHFILPTGHHCELYLFINSLNDSKQSIKSMPS